MNARDPEAIRRLSTALCAGKMLEELFQLRRDYPSACPDAEARELADNLALHLEVNLPENLKHAKPSLTLETDPLDFSMLNTLLMFELPPARDATDLDATIAAMKESLLYAQEHFDAAISPLVERVQRIGLIECRIPSPVDPASPLNDRRRTVPLLSLYWSLLRELLNYRIASPVFLNPDPMLPMTEVLWLRIEACLDRLTGHPEVGPVRQAAEFLYSGLVDGEPDDLQVIRDAAQAYARTVDRFIARRLAVASFQFEPTRQEGNFATVFRAKLHETKSSTDKHWRIILAGTEHTAPRPESSDAITSIRHLSTQLARFSDEILGGLERIEDSTRVFDELSTDEISGFQSLGQLAREFLEVRVLADQRKATITVGQQVAKDIYDDRVPKVVRTLIAALRRSNDDTPS